MPDFPRTVKPRSASYPKQPPGLDSWGASGKGQFRDIIHFGVVWEETYQPFAAGAVGRAFMVLVNQYWRNRIVFDIDHVMLTLMGAGGGTPLVNGASQTGATIATDGWTANITGILKAGDIIKFAGVNLVYWVTADANSNGSGQVTIPINPPIYTGGSPADNAAITISGVKFRAVIADLEMPETITPDVYAGLTINFREAP